VIRDRLHPLAVLIHHQRVRHAQLPGHELQHRRGHVQRVVQERPQPADSNKLKREANPHVIAAPRFGDTLVRDHLIDEFRFWIRPVVAGAGQRLFEDVDTSALHLRLTGERSLDNGSVILTYVPADISA
jgi:dihydrofolate reductase